MIITQIELETWKRIHSLELSFSNGINLIYGRNEIGKSTIIDAIQKAFWGNPAGSGSEYKNLKPWGTDVSAKVELTFSLKDQYTYRIEKSFPRGMANLYLNGTKLTDSASKTQKELLNILDISEKTVGLFHLLFINQGETLNIFNKKDNPLNDHAKSYLKNVIKETAFKEIQAFEDKLKEEHDVIFTATGKPKKNSLYAQLLEIENDKGSRLEFLSEKETVFTQNLEKMEIFEKQIRQFDSSNKKYEENLKQLNQKKKRLEDYEKKQLIFAPAQKNYERLLEIENVFKEIDQQIPLLWVMRTNCLNKIELKIQHLEKEKAQVQLYSKKLRNKKKMIDKSREKKQKYDQIVKQFDQLLQLQKKMADNKKMLPELFALNRRKLNLEQKIISDKINNYKSKLVEIESQVKKIKTDVSASENDVVINCKISPLQDKEIAFMLKKDSEKKKSYQSKSPLEFNNIKQMIFQYQDELCIEVAGQQKQSRSNAADKNDKKTNKETMLDQLVQLKNQYLEEIQKLEENQTEMNHRITSLQKDIENYLEENIDIEKIKLEPTKFKKPLSFWNETLLKTLEAYKANQTQINDMLGKQSFNEFEQEYSEAKKEFDLLTDELNKIEPLDLSDIKDEDIDREIRRGNSLLLKLQERQNDRDVLLNIEKPFDFTEILPPDLDKKDKTPQAIRDELQQLTTRLAEITKQKKQLLQEQGVEDFKRKYFAQKDELQNLFSEIKQVEPQNITTLEGVQKEIFCCEEKIKNCATQKIEIEKQKAEISGEMKDYGLFIEDLNNTKYDHQKTLAELKSELVDIFAVELLLQIVAEEKEKTQREIFRPLQHRVMQAFSKLTEDRYQILIDNELNLDIAAKSLTGEYLNNMNPFLSFGTKEQLSFLLRLAVAEQLSQKEPQVMILDDSFVNSDHFRLSQMMEIMQEKRKDIQFLVFTCKTDEFLKYKDQLNCIDLEGML